jgi:hypothetical protein
VLSRQAKRNERCADSAQDSRLPSDANENGMNDAAIVMKAASC